MIYKQAFTLLLATALQPFAHASPLGGVEQTACSDSWKAAAGFWAGCPNLVCARSDLTCNFRPGDSPGLAGAVRLGQCAECEETGEWVPRMGRPGEKPYIPPPPPPRPCAESWKAATDTFPGCPHLTCAQSELLCTLVAGDTSGIGGAARIGRCAQCAENGEWVPKMSGVDMEPYVPPPPKPKCPEKWKEATDTFPGCPHLTCAQSELLCTLVAGDTSGIGGAARIGRCARCEGSGDWVPDDFFKL